MSIGNYCFSGDFIYSGKNEVFDNPFVAVGFNPKNKLLTGYVRGLRTAPGRTDSCEFIFEGTIENNGASKITISEVDHVATSGLKLVTANVGRANFFSINGQKKVSFDNKANFFQHQRSEKS